MSGEYLRILLLAAEKGTLSRDEFAIAHVAHDDWCGIYSNASCNCNPDISIKRDGQKTIHIDKNGDVKNKRWKH